MAFMRRRAAAAHQICLEIEVVDDEVCANVRGPAVEGPPLRLKRVPLRQAIVLAARLATHCNTDVALIDRHGLWPE
jgi:hypothetical protein